MTTPASTAPRPTSLAEVAVPVSAILLSYVRMTTSGATEVEGPPRDRHPGPLLEATQACLRSRGLARTSSRSIADAAGANLGAITYYFGSKEQLVAAALAEELRAWIQPVLELLAGIRRPGRAAAPGGQHPERDVRATARPGTRPAGGLRARRARSRRGQPGRSDLAGAAHSSRPSSPSCSPTARFPDGSSPDAMAALILAVGAGTVVSARSNQNVSITVRSPHSSRACCSQPGPGREGQGGPE